MGLSPAHFTIATPTGNSTHTAALYNLTSILKLKTLYLIKTEAAELGEGAPVSEVSGGVKGHERGQ